MKGTMTLFTLWLWLLFATTTMAARTIEGLITDLNGAPLVGVSVVTNLPGVGTISDETGRYTITDSEGVARLTFTSIGYQSQQYAVTDLSKTVVMREAYYRGEDIIVRSDRAEQGITPVAFDNFSADEIARDYTVGEFPLLLESTPNLYSFSDGGASLGYSYTKIRGFDDKRIVTYINGVPLNDPEDHATYFVDLPDFAANVSDIQIQRGVGNSLYGDASFGGSVNIVTNPYDRPRSASILYGYGEYTSDGKSVSDIYKQSVDFSSGLVDGQWHFSGRFSKQKSGGYRHDSWYEGWAYYLAVARLDPRMSTEFHVYGGPIRMHLSYYGSPRGAIESDRRVNPLNYDNETDNFNQPHYQLHNVYRLDDNATLSNTLYYIRGKGYYEQYRFGEIFEEYNIDSSLLNFDTSTGQPYQSGDLVRQQWVAKNQLGWNPRLDVEHARGMHSLGGSFYYFDSDHWGQVVWAQNISGSLNPRQRYYQYHGKKYVGSIFAQEFYKLSERFSVQGTVQVRYQKYNFDQEKMGAFIGYDYNVDWLFFSPRLGLNYAMNEQLSLFTNFAVASRTPSDADIYDANDPNILPSLEVVSAVGDSIYVFGDPTAKSERVYDFELGGQWRQREYAFGVNLYWMDFQNEIIPYGGLNENTGIAFTTNANRSVHAGVELTGAHQMLQNFNVSGNLAYNYNRVKKYVGEIDVYVDVDVNRLEVDYKGKKIPGFPDWLGNVVADYNDGRLRGTLRLRYAGKQYMELFNIDSLAIEPFVTASLSGSYRFKNFLNAGDLTMQIRVDNLFDKKYEIAGYGWTYGFNDGGSPQNTLVHEAEYYVAPERSFYGQIILEMF